MEKRAQKPTQKAIMAQETKLQVGNPQRMKNLKAKITPSVDREVLTPSESEEEGSYGKNPTIEEPI